MSHPWYGACHVQKGQRAEEEQKKIKEMLRCEQIVADIAECLRQMKNCEGVWEYEIRKEGFCFTVNQREIGSRQKQNNFTV